MRAVLNIFPCIFTSTKQTERAYAIELLESLTNDNELKSSLKLFECDKCIISSKETDECMQQYRDAWLNLVLHYQQTE
jgi:hypothetical protein